MELEETGTPFPGDTEPAKGKRGGGVCATCGTPISDKRRKRCDDCGGTKSTVPVPSKPKRTPKGKTISGSNVERGMTKITATLLSVITVMIAYAQLRNVGVIGKHREQLAETLAFTDEESVAVAKPLSRIFMSTEMGRKAAPIIVQNEDVIDAAFALFDWYKRTQGILDSFQAGTLNRNVDVEHDNVVVKMRKEPKQNESSESPETDSRDGGQPGYIPPGPYDVIS